MPATVQIFLITLTALAVVFIVAKLENIETKLYEIERNIMPVLDDIKRELGVINGTTNEIAADIDELITKISGGGLTEAEAQSIVTDLQGLSTTLKGVAEKYPVVPPPPA